MKVKYFQDTHTLYIEFRSVEVAETTDLDEDTWLDFDRGANICGITIEHARDRAEIPKFSYEQISAQPSAGQDVPQRRGHRSAQRRYA